MKKGNDFTLIELLAVIAILAIILVISIPKILDVIEESKINTLKNTVKLIADSAEKKYTENEAFDEEEDITCESVSKLSSDDYKKCTITFDENGIAKVSILGKGKFDKLKVTNGTKTNAEVIKLEEPKYGITAVEYITNLYEYDSESNNLKIDNTVDENIRYHGSNPNNYVSFNNELWRIIGVFGNNVKLVRKYILGELSWDVSDSSVNVGWGINQWGESTYEDGTPYEGADLMLYLNKMYYGGDTTVTCYYGNTTTCPKDSKGNYLMLNDESKNMIENYTWKLGAVDYEARTDTLLFYQEERGTKTGKICTGGRFCDDTVNRTVIWTGYVALPYITDHAYASSETICETNMSKQDDSNNYICKNNNWMLGNTNTRYLSPATSYDYASSVWDAYANGNTDKTRSSNSWAIVPSIYLKFNVLISSGNGSENSPYILSIN